MSYLKIGTFYIAAWTLAYGLLSNDELTIHRDSKKTTTITEMEKSEEIAFVTPEEQRNFNNLTQFQKVDSVLNLDDPDLYKNKVSFSGFYGDWEDIESDVVVLTVTAPVQKENLTFHAQAKIRCSINDLDRYMENSKIFHFEQLENAYIQGDLRVQKVVPLPSLVNSNGDIHNNLEIIAFCEDLEFQANN